ncbi:MAG: RNA polymerase sigma factor [Planctomycetota bacterium]|jgi:RNA polymerase sigma-70 factor (ECF subfamily)
MTDWETIVRRHGPLVWRTAYRLLGQHADAADCYQEAFMSALEVARREPVRDWPRLLRTVTTRRALDGLRKRYHQARNCDGRADAAALHSSVGDPVRRAESAELREKLRRALARLPERQAEAFCLRCVEGMSYRKIAAHLGTDTNTVGVLIHRARVRLSELLNKSGDGP